MRAAGGGRTSSRSPPSSGEPEYVAQDPADKELAANHAHKSVCKRDYPVVRNGFPFRPQRLEVIANSSFGVSPNGPGDRPAFERHDPAGWEPAVSTLDPYPGLQNPSSSIMRIPVGQFPRPTRKLGLF